MKKPYSIRGSCKRLVIACFFLVVPVFTYSQTAQAIEELLDTQAVNMQQAAWLVLEAANLSGPAGIISQAEAFRYAVEQQWLPANAEPNSRIRLDRFSLLVMRAFDMRGGIFYSIFGNPHYAYRELVYRNVILGRADPGMAVSGYELLYVVNRILAFQEADLL